MWGGSLKFQLKKGGLIAKIAGEKIVRGGEIGDGRP